MSVEAVSNLITEQSAGIGHTVGRILGPRLKDCRDLKEAWTEFKKPIDELRQDLQKTGQEIKKIVSSPAEKLSQIAIPPQEPGETAGEGDFEIVSVTKSREEKEAEEAGFLAAASLLAVSTPITRRAMLIGVPLFLAACNTEQPEGDPQALTFDLKEKHDSAEIARQVFARTGEEGLGIFRTEQGLAEFIQGLPRDYPLRGKAESLEVTEDGLIVRTNDGLSYKTMVLTSAMTGGTDSGDAWPVLGSKPISLDWGEKIVWFWDQNEFSWKAKYLGQNGRGGDILSEKQQEVDDKKGELALPASIPSPTLFPTVFPTETRPPASPTKTLAPEPSKTPAKVATPTVKKVESAKTVVQAKSPTRVPPTAAPTAEVFNIPDVFSGKAGNTRWEKNWGDSKTNLWLAFGRLTKIEVKGTNLTAFIDTQNNGQVEAFTFTITPEQPVLFLEPIGNGGTSKQTGGQSWQTGSAAKAKAAIEKFYEVGKSGIGFAFFPGNPDSGMLKQNIVWYPK